MDHRHILFFDPFQIEREEIGAEAVGAAVFEAGGRTLFVGPENPAAAFLADVPFGVGVSQDRVFRVGLSVFDKGRVGFGDDVLMLDRDGGDL